MNYTPLYVKTHNSLLSSTITIEGLINYAINNNIKSLSICDNTMYGVMDFYHLCKKNNIKPIIGLEVTLDNKKIVLYCKDNIGYTNLIYLCTKQSEEKIDLNVLKDHSTNIICILPFDSLSLYEDLSNIYVDIFKGYSTLEERNTLEGNNLIFINETLSLTEEDSTYLHYVIAIKEGTTVDKIEINAHSYIYSLDTIKKISTKDLENNYYITNNCNIEFTKNNDLLPLYPCPNNMTSYEYLKKLCVEGLRRLFGEYVGKVYVDRLKYELDIINKMGFCNYFLVVWDYVNYCKNNDILVGPGRGSAAGSLVSYVLNITTVDPIKYNLLFERFLNPERITMPDIDIDFEYTKREDVVNYCIEKYGIKKVAPIITFGTLGAKQAIRDVGRCMNISLSMIDRLCSYISSTLSLKDNYKDNQKLRDYLEINSELKKVYKVASKLEGLKRHTSIHAAGIVMSRYDLDTIIPLDKGHNDFYTTGYSMEYLEEIGLLKMDFLALRNLTLIKEILDDAKIKFDDIPDNDSKALNIFTTANTSGIFQFESSGMVNFLRKFKPTTMDDIIAALALFRPGPMNNIDSYIKRKHGKEKIDYLDKSLESILKPTYGIIVYQEQIMQIASVLAGYSLGEADVLRRAMSKKKENVLLEEKEKFVKRSVAKGYSLETATKVYDLILKFASYGFNKAHSVAYSLISYRMAYLKAHYPFLFMKSLLTSNIGSESKTREYIYECKANNINILKPSINHSSSTYVIYDNNILFPLTCIKNVGINATNMIIEERAKGEFKDIFEFAKRCYGKSVTRKTLENLILAGCFDEFGLNKRTLMNNLDIIVNYSELGEFLEDDDSLKPVITEETDYSKVELMQMELDIFGFYLSNHPVTEYKNIYKNAISISNIPLYFNKNVELVVYIDKIREITTKDNSKMCFLTVSDEISTLDVVLFPKTYEKYNNIEEKKVARLFGRVEKRFDKYQLVAEDIKIL